MNREPQTANRKPRTVAVVHRDYTSPSDIQIKIFDDRITFFNPGKLYGGLTVEDLQTDNYQSHLRNKLIAEAFYLTVNIEKYGSGFIRIRKELEGYQRESFAVEEIGEGVLVTFRSSGGVNEGVNEGVNQGIESLYGIIQENPGKRVPFLAQRLETSVKNIERWLKQLRDEGKIEFRGAPKTGGYFSIENSEP